MKRPETPAARVSVASAKCLGYSWLISFGSASSRQDQNQAPVQSDCQPETDREGQHGPRREMRQANKGVEKGHQHAEQRKPAEYKAHDRLQNDQERQDRQADKPPSPSQSFRPDLVRAEAREPAREFPRTTPEVSTASSSGCADACIRDAANSLLTNHAFVLTLPLACQRRATLQVNQRDRVGQTYIGESCTCDHLATGVPSALRSAARPTRPCRTNMCRRIIEL